MTKSTRWMAAGLAVSSLALAGCHKERVQTVKNVERALTRWPDETGTGVPHICVEYSTAAEKLHDRDAGVTVPVGEVAVNLSYKDKESLASIYSVSEIMQFGHAALYRLCEASGNRAIDSEGYKELFSSTIDKVHGLIELELLREKLNSVEHLVVMESQLKDLDRERCRLSASKSAGAARELIELNGRRKSQVEEIERLQTVLGATMTHSLPTDSLPTSKEWDDIRTTADAVIAAREAFASTGTSLDKQSEAQQLLKSGKQATPQGKLALDWKTACDGLRSKLTKTDGACEAPVELLEACP